MWCYHFTKIWISSELLSKCICLCKGILAKAKMRSCFMTPPQLFHFKAFLRAAFAITKNVVSRSSLGKTICCAAPSLQKHRWEAGICKPIGRMQLSLPETALVTWSVTAWDTAHCQERWALRGPRYQRGTGTARWYTGAFSGTNFPYPFLKGAISREHMGQKYKVLA